MTPVGTALPPPPVLPAHRDRGGGGGGWIELVTARNDIDAHLLTGRLHEAGVETRTVPDRSAAGAWLLGGSNPWAPVAVWVPSLQHDTARLVLAELSLEAQRVPQTPAAEAPRRRWPLAWWAVALVVGLVMTLLSLLQTIDHASAGDGLQRRAAMSVAGP